jgi:hypothetical protein
MSNLIHRTYPRLLTAGTLCLLSIFSLGLTFIIISQTINSEITTLSILYMVLASLTTCVLLYYLYKIKVVFVSKSQIIVSHFFFPKKQFFDLSEIRTIRQSKKTTTHYLGVNDSPFDIKSDSYKINWYKTLIETNDKRKIILNHLGEMEFDLLLKVFSKRKRGEGKVKKVKGRLVIYLIDNLGGLFFNLLLIFLLGGLLISLVEKMN